MKSKILLLVGIFLLTLSTAYAQDDSTQNKPSGGAKTNTSGKTKSAKENKRNSEPKPLTIVVELEGIDSTVVFREVSRSLDTSHFKTNLVAILANENPNVELERIEWQDLNYSKEIPATVETLLIKAICKEKQEIMQEGDEEAAAKEDTEVEPEPKPQSNLPLWTISILALVLSITGIVVAVILYLKKKKQFEEKVVNIVANSPTLMQWRDQAATNTVQPTYTPRSSFDDGDFRDLRKRVSDLEDQLRKEQSLSTTTVSSSQKSNAPRSLYAESIVNDKLMRVKESPNEDSIFELKLQGDSRASVTIYKGAHNRVLQNPSFLDGCDKQVIGNSSLSVRQEGRAEKDENGKWKLVSKVDVILNR